MNLRIAITGGTGFIGRYVTNLLIEKNYELLVIGRKCPIQNRNLTFIQHDLLKSYDYQWLKEYQPTHLLHMAWYAEHAKFWTSPLNLKWCNASVQLIEAFYQSGGKRVVVAGSCAEYDWSFGYCQEKLTPSNPTTLYGIAKDSARRMIMELSRLNNTSLAWGRIFFPFGLGEDLNRLIPSVIQTCLGKRQPFPIAIRQWRDILPVEVVADALVFLLTQEESGIFNVCSGHPMQIIDIIKEVATITSTDPKILLSLGVERNHSPCFLVGDNTMISSLGWNCPYNLQERLKLYVEALDNHSAVSKVIAYQ